MGAYSKTKEWLKGTPSDDKTKYIRWISIGVSVFIVILIANAVYQQDRPILIFKDEELLKNTGIRQGEVVKVDYEIKSAFNKPIGRTNFLIYPLEGIREIEFLDASFSAANPTQVLDFRFIPDPPTTHFDGWIYMRANTTPTLKEGESRYYTLVIYADYLDLRPKELTESSMFYHQIGEVTVKVSKGG